MSYFHFVVLYLSLYLSGVYVTSSPGLPLLVGTNATLICINDAGIADVIEWTSSDGTILTKNTSVNMSILLLSPVNDSLCIHGAVFTCYVNRSNKVHLQNLSVGVTCKYTLVK